MDGVEIITGRERRRRWSPSEKLRLVAETHEPGTTIGAVAARHGACWRRCANDPDRLGIPDQPAVPYLPDLISARALPI